MTSPRVLADLDRAGLRLLRSWPRSPDHLLLEVSGVSEASGRTAGQWFAHEQDAERVEVATTGSRRLGRVVLQPAGTDRRLPALAGLVRRPGHRLVAHRPERRAVVQGPAGYTKVVRPSRLQHLAETSRATEHLPVRTPQVLDVDDRLGSVTVSALPGRTLHELLDNEHALQACRATGDALARLHAFPVPAGTAEHGTREESAVVQRWVELARAYGHRIDSGVELDGPPSGRCLLHRDLHDKQVLVDADGSVGVIDFDLLAAGDPALDLANLLVHLHLRAMQGLVADPEPLQTAVLDGYRPSEAVLDRVPAYAQAVRARLAAVYAFRPGTHREVLRLG